MKIEDSENDIRRSRSQEGCLEFQLVLVEVGGDIYFCIFGNLWAVFIYWEVWVFFFGGVRNYNG